MNEHEHEPVPGLPEELPPGEKLLWQGTPRVGALAVRAFHVRKVGIYFALLMAWRAGSDLVNGESVLTALGSAVGLLPVAVLGVGLLWLLAWLCARSTIYTITNRRLVLRFGVALSMALNIPFKVVESASLRTFSDGTGDLPLALTAGQRIGWFVNWPYVRPWSRGGVQPMLRAVADPDAVARLLASALADASGGQALPTSRPVRADAQGVTGRPATA